MRINEFVGGCICWLLVLAVLAGCAQPPAASSDREPVVVQLTADGEVRELTTQAATVRDLLAQAGVTLGELDEVTPPLFTPLEPDLAVTVVRVSESLEIIPQTIPFDRRFVRSESMNADDPPVIVQAGKAGLQETTWRIVYRDGLEAERWPTSVSVVEPAQDEIIMIGIGAARGNVIFPGAIAYISDGAAVLLRGATAFPVQIETGGRLDGRVFALSPTGSHLLYSRAMTDTNRFNNALWVTATTPGAKPQSLNVENVLWAGWNPALTDGLQIAYTTARPTDAPPGWEANNDLWIGDVPEEETADFVVQQLIETYPATYGWWGGHYAWSPDGHYIAYSFADEVGVINVTPESEPAQHRPLQRFTEYNTLANWVWLPTMSWSPDSRFLIFTNHGGDNDQSILFDSWAVDVESGVSGRFVNQIGMWGHLHWQPVIGGGVPDSSIAFLRAVDPTDSQRSSYTLWLMDRDGSNARQIYPAVGENSNFPRHQQFMAWGPSGQEMVFIFNDDLFHLHLVSNEVRRVTEGDAVNSHPTWAPYGAALTENASAAPDRPPPPPPPEGSDGLLPGE